MGNAPTTERDWRLDHLTAEQKRLRDQLNRVEMQVWWLIFGLVWVVILGVIVVTALLDRLDQLPTS